MQFDFHMTKSIFLQRGGSTNLANPMQERGDKSVLIVTDPGVLSARLLEKTLSVFKSAGLLL